MRRKRPDKRKEKRLPEGRVIQIDAQSSREAFKEHMAQIVHHYSSMLAHFTPLLKTLAMIGQYAGDQWRTIEMLRQWGYEPALPVILEKMHRSKGLLEGLKTSGEVTFIPDAVICYGFAHLPTESDPEGMQVKVLPPKPSSIMQIVGAYLFTPKQESAVPASVSPHEHRNFIKARDVYEQSGRKGIDPQRVLDTLLMAPLLTKIWVQIDPERDLDAQLSQFKKWLPHAQRQLYGRSGTRKHARRYAARDTLIFTLTESAGLSDGQIARKLPLTPWAVRKVVKRTRDVLRAFEIIPPASSGV